MDLNGKYDYQKLPSVERVIREIDAGKDKKVRVIGTVVAKDESSFVIDDGSGSLRVSARPEMMDIVADKKVVRVIGKPSYSGSHFILEADIVQDMTKMNTKFYRIVNEKWKSIKG